MNLIWMGFTIENFPCYVDGIGDDDDLGHVLLIAYLVDTTPNCEKLHFSTSDESCMMNHLGQRMIDEAYMQYRYSNIILDDSICYNNGHKW